MGIALVAVASMAGAADAATGPKDRYGFVHGCYELASEQGAPIAPASGPFRLQATRLGDYLLYGIHRDVLADPGTGVPTPAAVPSTAAEWTVRGSRHTGWSITNKATGKILRVAFTEAEGCAVYPEGSTGATGTPAAAEDLDGPAFGYVDGHMHWMAYEFLGGDFHCGRPWHPYGIAYALPDCAQYDAGTNGQVRAFLDGRTPGETYDSKGYPTFSYWPGPNRLSEEGTYYTGVERAWLAGLRVLVVDFVDNEALCQLMTTAHNPCHDMEAVRLQNRDLEELEDYVDAQSGGPGKGWMRIVSTPEEARRVINRGKLAVVKGIELSRVLDCGEVEGTPECDKDQVDRGLRELHDMGIASFFPVHKFDNGFGGTKMDGGEIGVIVNTGNAYKTGHFWDVGPCGGPTSDQTQLTTPPTEAVASLVYGPLGLLAPVSRLPIYGSGPHCNQKGLTDMGRYLIDEMIDQHFIIEVDHMDEKTADATLDIVESRGYPGVINSHGGWSSNASIDRILAAGGMSTIGTDINGLGGQPGPNASQPITYPFTSRDGRVTFDRQQWGERTFDINTDGVAQYGVYADWIERERVAHGEEAMRSIFGPRGAEAYLQMWERARAHEG